MMTNEPGMPVVRFSIFSGYPVTAAFSTRWGGVSEGPFGTLNLGLHVGDVPSRVLENRRRFGAALGVDAGRFVCGEQVHGARVAVVGPGDIGRGARAAETALPATDALVTAAPGVPLAAFFADCVPLFFYDPVRHAAALAHAGRRGAVAGIGPETVGVMGRRFNVDPADIRAVIGPSVGPCCYRVGPAVADEFARVFGARSGVLKRTDDGAVSVDLWRANRLALVGAGLRPGRIETAGICTACRAGDYFSYRAAQGRTGRLGALMMLE